MQVLAPLDALRRGAMATLLDHRAPSFVLARRDRRLTLLAVLGVTVSLAVTFLLPMAAFVAAPLLLGVPHVASDVRYLVLRRALPRSVVLFASAVAASLLVVAVSQLFAAEPSQLPVVELLIGGVSTAALAVFGAFRHKRILRGAVAVAIVAIALVFALRNPRVARLVLAHGHNLVGVAIWAVVFRPARRPAWAVTFSIVVAVAIALTGLPSRVAETLDTDHAFGVSAPAVAAILAPGLSGAAAAGATSAYILLQGVHYAAWLSWIPQDDLRGQGTLTFSQTVRGLVRDFRWVGLALIGAAWAAVLCAAVVSASSARDTYIALASFHAYLELALLAYFLCSSTAPARLPSRSKGEERRVERMTHEACQKALRHEAI